MTMGLLMAALLMGFSGSPRCLGLCSGIVAAFELSIKDISSAKKRGLIASYHLGRLHGHDQYGS